MFTVWPVWLQHDNISLESGWREGSCWVWLTEADHYDTVFASLLNRGGGNREEALTDDDVFVYV